MRITESKLRKIIRSVIVENEEIHHDINREEHHDYSHLRIQPQEIVDAIEKGCCGSLMGHKGDPYAKGSEVSHLSTAVISILDNPGFYDGDYLYSQHREFVDICNEYCEKVFNTSGPQAEVNRKELTQKCHNVRHENVYLGDCADICLHRAGF